MAYESIIAGRYKLGKKIGSGSFGEIHTATCIDNGEEVAIKLEPAKTRYPQLLYEYKVMQHLGIDVGVPRTYWAGSEGDYNVMVMELLGPSLEDLFNYCKRRISLKTALMVADQMFSRIEYVHSRYFIHRDMKPDNFIIGRGAKSGIIYVIDFGLAKRYKDPKTGHHIPYRNNKTLTGTARYASVNTHMGIEQSRRDDIEGILYVILYFLRGSLPWQGLTAKNKNEKYKKIMDMKMSTSTETLCKGLPSEFQNLLKYCKCLKFEEEPNYPYIKEQLKSVFVSNGFVYDLNYDWTVHAAAMEKKSTFLHLAGRQNQLAKRYSVRKDMGAEQAGDGKKEDWKNSRLMKHSMPQLLKSPANEQNSMMVNYTSCVHDASSKGNHDHPNGHPQADQTKGTDRAAVSATQAVNEQKKEKKKCCCLVL